MVVFRESKFLDEGEPVAINPAHIAFFYQSKAWDGPRPRIHTRIVLANGVSIDVCGTFEETLAALPHHNERTDDGLSV